MRSKGSAAKRGIVGVMLTMLLMSLLTMAAQEGDSTAPRLVAFSMPYPRTVAEELAKQEWVALFPEKDRVAPVRLVLGERTTIYDEEPAYEIETDPKGAAFAFPAGVVTKGSVVNGTFDADGFPYRRDAVDIVLGERSYSLRAEGFSDYDQKIQRIVLREGEREQVLFESTGVDEPPIYIRWAGDLDRDGRLDLITNFSPKYSVHHVKLWLSSISGEGEIVGLAAAEMTYGC